MTTNLFGEKICTSGHEEQCGLARCKNCACACGGENHGKRRTVMQGAGTWTINKIEYKDLPQKKREAMWKGKPLSNYNKEELIKIVCELGGFYNDLLQEKDSQF